MHGATCDCCPTSLNFVIGHLSIDLEAQEKFLHSKFRYFLRSNSLWGNQSYAFCICSVGSCRGSIATFARSSFYFLGKGELLFLCCTLKCFILDQPRLMTAMPPLTCFSIL